MFTFSCSKKLGTPSLDFQRSRKISCATCSTTCSSWESPLSDVNWLPKSWYKIWQVVYLIHFLIEFKFAANFHYNFINVENGKMEEGGRSPLLWRRERRKKKWQGKRQTKKVDWIIYFLVLLFISLSLCVVSNIK